MEFYQLEQLIAIADCGSMSLAADRLFLSRSALSQNLKRLEQELGCELFMRRRNKLEITSYGEILLEHARTVVCELNEATERIAEEKRSGEAILRVAHFSQPLSYFKMPHLAQAMPQYTFAVDICDQALALEGVMDGTYDFAIVPASLHLPDVATIFELEKERACLSVPKDSLLFDREEVRLDEIKGVKLLLTDNMPGLSNWYRELAESTDVSLSDITIVPADQYLATMSKSDACHFSTTHMVNFFGLGDGRKTVQISDECATRDIVLITKNPSDQRIVDVLEHLAREKQNSFDAYDIFPFLIVPGQIDNLTLALVQ